MAFTHSTPNPQVMSSKRRKSRLPKSKLSPRPLSSAFATLVNAKGQQKPNNPQKQEETPENRA
jgi:hypothetical protein